VNTTCVGSAKLGGNANAGRLNYTIYLDGVAVLFGKSWSLGEVTTVDLEVTNIGFLLIVISPIGGTVACDQLVFVRMIKNILTIGQRENRIRNRIHYILLESISNNNNRTSR
jgi:hypothetical protein